MTQLPVELGSEISEYETNDEDNGNSRDGESDAGRHAFRDETWSQEFFTYDPKPMEFIGRRGTSQFFQFIPTVL
jgi:hypothetical protein